MTQTQDVIKVSVLTSGAILLDGNAVSLSELEAAFQAAKDRGAGVLYHREAAAAEPPAEAQRVLQAIVANRLPVSLSSKPDFSDWVDGQGLSHPRDAAGGAAADLAFAKTRQQASSQRGVAIVRPDGQALVLPAPPPGSMPPAATMSVEAMVPPGVPRNVAVIADTSFAAASKPEIAEIGRAIPFLGFLIGLRYIGHAVWIFDADGSTLAAGCRDADVLIVDSAAASRLPKEWVETVSGTMRNANIVVLDRATQKFLVVRTAGETKGKLEFPR